MVQQQVQLDRTFGPPKLCPVERGPKCLVGTVHKRTLTHLGMAPFSRDKGPVPGLVPTLGGHPRSPKTHNLR
jgi:hypothetical protein